MSASFFLFLFPISSNWVLQIDVYVPFLTIVQFIFLVGWSKVAESLLNPWGDDDDDFEVNFIIDRNLRMAFCRFCNTNNGIFIFRALLPVIHETETGLVFQKLRLKIFQKLIFNCYMDQKFFPDDFQDETLCFYRLGKQLSLTPKQNNHPWSRTHFGMMWRPNHCTVWRRRLSFRILG